MKRAFALVVFAACGGARAEPTEPAAPPPPEHAAQVCLIRPEAVASEVTMRIHDNGRLVGATRGATYVCWLALPGEHQIAADADDTGPTLFQAAAGRRYWLHQEVEVLGDHAHAHLDWIDEARAEELLEACRARVMVSVPGHEDEAGAMRLVPALSPR